ncbi:MAG: hypothetical protein ACI9FD_002684 [Gammaproteobacteria bacterium]|jgi:hypothetical protein
MIFTGTVAESFKKDMGYAHREFLNNLPAAMKGTPYQISDNNKITVTLEQGQLIIHLGEQMYRNIASISLPYMTVSFVFTDINEVDRTRFYRQFQRSYQKGGG